MVLGSFLKKLENMIFHHLPWEKLFCILTHDFKRECKYGSRRFVSNPEVFMYKVVFFSKQPQNYSQRCLSVSPDNVDSPRGFIFCRAPRSLAGRSF